MKITTHAWNQERVESKKKSSSRANRSGIVEKGKIEDPSGRDFSFSAERKHSEVFSIILYKMRSYVTRLKDDRRLGNPTRAFTGIRDKEGGGVCQNSGHVMHGG